MRKAHGFRWVVLSGFLILEGAAAAPSFEGAAKCTQVCFENQRAGAEGCRKRCRSKHLDARGKKPVIPRKHELPDGACEKRCDEAMDQDMARCQQRCEGANKLSLAFEEAWNASK